MKIAIYFGQMITQKSNEIPEVVQPVGRTKGSHLTLKPPTRIKRLLPITGSRSKPLHHWYDPTEGDKTKPRSMKNSFATRRAKNRGFQLSNPIITKSRQTESLSPGRQARKIWNKFSPKTTKLVKKTRREGKEL